MTLQVLAIATSALMLLGVIELVRRQLLDEGYSLPWILCAAVLLVLSVWRDLLHVVAGWLGVFYPPAVLLLVLLAFGFVTSLTFSVLFTRQRREIARLVEDQALLRAELQALRAELHPPPGPPDQGG